MKPGNKKILTKINLSKISSIGSHISSSQKQDMQSENLNNQLQYIVSFKRKTLKKLSKIKTLEEYFFDRYKTIKYTKIRFKYFLEMFTIYFIFYL